MPSMDSRRSIGQIGGSNLISRSAPGTAAHSFSENDGQGPAASPYRSPRVRHSSPENKTSSTSFDEPAAGTGHHHSSPAILVDHRRVSSTQMSYQRAGTRKTSMLSHGMTSDSMLSPTTLRENIWSAQAPPTLNLGLQASQFASGIPWPAAPSIWSSDTPASRQYSDAIPSPTTVVPVGSTGSGYFSGDLVTSAQTSRRSSNAFTKTADSP